MTGTEVDLDTQANQIAARGHAALVERMRIAYSDAAAAHADLISLDDERIEAMAQSAAERADGLQWRRALAAVAADELGLSPTEALAHPAVVRAQALVGAPSYEQSLAEMIARPVPLPTPVPESGSATHGNGAEPAGTVDTADPVDPVETADPVETTDPVGPEPSAGPQPEPQPESVVELEQETAEPVETAEAEPQAEQEEPEPQEPAPAMQAAASGAAWAQTEDDEEPSDELESVQADDVVLELLPEPDPIEYETEAYDVEASFSDDRVPPAPVNPFASQTPLEAAAAQELELEDDYDPPTEEHTSAGVAAAMAAVGAESSSPGATALDEEETEVTIPAIHLGGVANLPTKRDGLSVRLSADGLDIMQGQRDIIGRLVWDEIEALEVPNLRSRRRSKQMRARLVVRTPHGDASFEVPEVSGDDLRDRVEPLMRLYGRP